MRALKWLSLLLLSIFPFSAARAESGLTVTFFNVGKADAILVKSETSAVLIDAATTKEGDEVVAALRGAGVKALDCLIITHYDKDHVGGADAVVDALHVRRALNPAYPKDGKQYEQYIEALERAGVVPEFLTGNLSFELDGNLWEIDIANQSDYGEDEENDFSLVVRVTCGDCAFLFAGDAETPRLGELILEGNLAADVLKVPHHGVYEKRSPQFFEAVGARWGVITSSEDEPEDAKTVKALVQAGTEPLLTREGTIVMRCDGREITVSQ